MKLFCVLVSLFLFALTVDHIISSGPLTTSSRPFRGADLTILPQETPAAYSARMAKFLAESSTYCSELDAGFSFIEKAGAALAPKQLFVHGVLIRDKFSCGGCATKAAILKDILSDRGITSNVYFTQHVILRSGDIYFDPTFGIGPFKLADYRRAYRGIPPLSESASWDYIFSHPSGGAEEQGRWNAVIEMEKYMQGIFFMFANAAAVITGLLGCVFLWFAIGRQDLRYWQRIARLRHFIRARRHLRSWVRI